MLRAFATLYATLTFEAVLTASKKPSSAHLTREEERKRLILCNGFTQRCNSLQDRVGVFLRAKNASKRIINFLNFLGVKSSYEYLWKKEKVRRKGHYLRINSKIKSNPTEGRPGYLGN